VDALSFIASGNSVPQGWRQAKLDFLTRAAKPRAEVEFAIIPVIKELVVAASSRNELNSLAPDEWLKRVKAAASGKTAAPSSPSSP
jgi:hypothetical protein